jgi:hypothetical protein
MKYQFQYLAMVGLFILVTVSFNSNLARQGRETFIGKMSILNMNYLLCCILVVIFAVLYKKRMREETRDLHKRDHYLRVVRQRCKQTE